MSESPKKFIKQVIPARRAVHYAAIEAARKAAVEKTQANWAEQPASRRLRQPPPQAEAEDPKQFLRRMSAKQKADAEAARVAALNKAQRDREEKARRRRMRQPPGQEGQPESEAAQWVRDTFEWDEHLELWIPPQCSYSDYGGSFTDKANIQALLRDHPDIFEESGGSHGWTTCGMTEEKRLALTEDQWNSIKDEIEGLEDYPVIDEDLWSQLEWESKEEHWEEYGRDGIREALVKKFDGDVNAQIAVVARRNEFWDTMWREHDWDQNMEEEPGCSWYFREESAVRDIGRDEFVNDELVENVKRALFMKEYAGKLGIMLQRENVDYRDAEHLWEMVKYAESITTPENVWEVEGRYYGGKGEVDPDDKITMDLDEVVAVLTEPEAMQKMLNKHWAEDPRQLKMPGFEARQHSTEAVELAAALLEIEDPKGVLKAAKAAHPYGHQGIGPTGILQPLQFHEVPCEWPNGGPRFKRADGIVYRSKPGRLAGMAVGVLADPPFQALRDAEYQIWDSEVVFPPRWSQEEIRAWQQENPRQESEDPKSVFKQFSRSDNFWGPKWKQDDSGAWRAQPTSNRIYIIDPFSKGYCLTELWRGAMTGKWKEVYRKCFRTPEEVKAHFPLRLREAEDPKSVLRAAKDPLARAKHYIGNMPKKIEIWGRRWFSRTYGNTYFTARIYVNDQLIHTMPEEYGYGDHYMHRAFEWLEENGFVPERPRHANNMPTEPPWRWCQINNIEFLYHAEDIQRRRDRFV